MSSFPGFAPTNDTVNCEYLTGFKPVDSNGVIGCQAAESTHSWLGEYYVAQSHICPEFTGKLPTLAQFQIERGYDNYLFLDQTGADFEEGLESFFLTCVKILELDASLDKPDNDTSSVSLGFLCSVHTVSDTAK